MSRQSSYIRSVRRRKPGLTDVSMLGEVSIYVLEGTIGGLGVEEVRGRDERKAEDCPDDPEFIPQVRNARWRYLRDHIVHDPVGCHRQRSSLASK